MPALLVAQSWWAMGGLPMNAEAWSMDQALAQIAAAGFAAVHGGVRDETGARAMAAGLAEHGLDYIGNAVVGPDDDLDAVCAAQALAGARVVNLQLSPAFRSIEWNIARAQAAQAAADRAGLSLSVETHRGRITQDPLRALALIDALPDLRLTIDFSHYIVGGEGTLEDPIFQELVPRLLERTGMIHARVSNGNQTQVDVGPDPERPVSAATPFLAWWTDGLAQARAADVPVVPFVCELGPPPYAMVDLDGREFSDRWAQALVLKTIGQRCWDSTSVAVP